jgi:hypothetical protein
MIARGSLRDSLTLVTEGAQTGTSDFGDPEFGEAEVEVPCAVTPLDATEDEINRETRINRYYALIPADLGISVGEVLRVRWQDRELTVLGEPQLFTARGRQHHLRLELREVEG